MKRMLTALFCLSLLLVGCRTGGKGNMVTTMPTVVQTTAPTTAMTTAPTTAMTTEATTATTVPNSGNGSQTTDTTVTAATTGK